MTHPIATIAAAAGMSPTSVEQLAAAGIATTEELLTRCATPGGRTDIAARTGMGEDRLRAWAGLADLLRVAGVGPDDAALLAAAGISDVARLAATDPAALVDEIARGELAHQPGAAAPTAATVAEWVRRAADLPPLDLD